jgi:hypothetical protein
MCVWLQVIWFCFCGQELIQEADPAIVLIRHPQYARRVAVDLMILFREAACEFEQRDVTVFRCRCPFALFSLII